jgi:hypothetical protein
VLELEHVCVHDLQWNTVSFLIIAFESSHLVNSRQFNRKVKSITASEFNEDEVVGIENGGNDFAANYWLATYKPSDFPEPSSGEASKIKDFMGNSPLL